jgi:chemotaxis protein MotB
MPRARIRTCPRPRPSRIALALTLCSLPMFAGGCVQQEKYDALLMSNRSLQEQLVAAQDERDSAKANLDTIRAQLTAASGDLESLRQKYNLTDEEMRALAANYDELMKRVSGMDFGPLPDDMSKALADLAAQHPDMLTFDQKRGMLRFASDFTFALGSADLTSSANATVGKLAQILNTPSAATFEARIIGHTDNVPISKPDTRAKHPTNWHLSAHRAISVGSSLIASGINPQRVQVAGYGEYRPAVENPSKGGAAENRRVEIFLVPMPDTLTTSTPARVVTPSLSDEPMK